MNTSPIKESSNEQIETELKILSASSPEKQQMQLNTKTQTFDFATKKPQMASIKKDKKTVAMADNNDTQDELNGTGFSMNHHRHVIDEEDGALLTLNEAEFENSKSKKCLCLQKLYFWVSFVAWLLTCSVIAFVEMCVTKPLLYSVNRLKDLQPIHNSMKSYQEKKQKRKLLDGVIVGFLLGHVLFVPLHLRYYPYDGGVCGSYMLCLFYFLFGAMLNELLKSMPFFYTGSDVSISCFRKCRALHHLFDTLSSGSMFGMFLGMSYSLPEIVIHSKFIDLATLDPASYNEQLNLSFSDFCKPHEETPLFFLLPILFVVCFVRYSVVFYKSS